MTTQYQRFLKILEKWPIDKTKSGRDLSQQIRAQIKPPINATASTEYAANLDKQIDALERLANNTYYKKYKRLHNSTATGLTAEQCSKVLSSEFLQYLNENDKNSENSKE